MSIFHMFFNVFKRRSVRIIFSISTIAGILVGIAVACTKPTSLNIVQLTPEQTEAVQIVTQAEKCEQTAGILTTPVLGQLLLGVEYSSTTNCLEKVNLMYQPAPNQPVTSALFSLSIIEAGTGTDISFTPPTGGGYMLSDFTPSTVGGVTTYNKIITIDGNICANNKFINILFTATDITSPLWGSSKGSLEREMAVCSGNSPDATLACNNELTGYVDTLIAFCKSLGFTGNLSATGQCR